MRKGGGGGREREKMTKQTSGSVCGIADAAFPDVALRDDARLVVTKTRVSVENKDKVTIEAQFAQTPYLPVISLHEAAATDSGSISILLMRSSLIL